MIFLHEELELLKKLGKFIMQCWVKRKTELEKLNEMQDGDK